ncbi:MAG: hypothetical protein HGB34_02835 [Candidatus Moranbacteria bacterium]|nr:hypothetical protein [Candidatus Moranbacteria bacterium]
MADNPNLHTLGDKRLRVGNRIVFLAVQNPQGKIMIKGKKSWHDVHANNQSSIRQIVFTDGRKLKHKPGTVFSGTIVSVSNGRKTKERRPIHLHVVNVSVKDVHVEKSATEKFAYFRYGKRVIEIQEIFIGDVRLAKLCWSLRLGKDSRSIPFQSLPELSRLGYDCLGRKVDWKRRQRVIDSATAERIRAAIDAPEG